MLHLILFGTCEINLPISFTKPWCQALACCSANTQGCQHDAADSALLRRSNAWSWEIKSSFWLTFTIMVCALLLLLLLWYSVSTNMESDSLLGTLRAQENEDSLNLDLHLGKASPPTSGSPGLSAGFFAATRLNFITLIETKPSSMFHHDDEWNMWRCQCQTSLCLCLTLTYITRFLCT